MEKAGYNSKLSLGAIDFGIIVDGAVVMVDCTRDMDEITLSLFQWLKTRGIPVVVMANKCDCPGALPDRVRDLVPWFPVHAISARTGS
jgi:signal recognition particle receptor subunit beta